MPLRARRGHTSTAKRPHLVNKQADEGLVEQAFVESRALRIFAVLAVALLVAYILMLFFEPGLDYRLSDRLPALDSPEFQRTVESMVGAQITRDNRVEALPNGEDFYAAELEAIRQARRDINLEAYIWHEGEITRTVLDALSEKARAGVSVRMVVDGAGSATSSKRSFKKLLTSGGRIEFYHPLSWKTWWRYNNRTHREMLIVDGAVGFIGGAGYDDQWILSTKKEPRWRDNMFRLTGSAVAQLQRTFVENWLESSGEVLSAAADFAADGKPGHASAMVVPSSPSQGRSTPARILYQVLLGGARKSIYISTPYFLPDKGALRALHDARKRGVDVTILVPNGRNDHTLTRAASRTYYGELLKEGAKVYEYQPSMLHQKMMIVDGEWSVVGSTNFDSRSFQLNDEVNLAALDSGLAGELTRLFENDLRQSKEITYDQWRKRPPWERVLGWASWVTSRQQ